MAKERFPQVKEFFFDDDTFTADFKRAEEIARRISTLGITWSCTSRPNVPYETLKVMRDCGLRVLLVGYESGNEEILKNIRKGINTKTATQFTKDCKSLGILIHGCFILGLPGETKETVEQTIRYACDIDPDTIQVSLPAPYPGTELYEQATANGWLVSEDLAWSDGAQLCPVQYDGSLGKRDSGAAGQVLQAVLLPAQGDAENGQGNDKGFGLAQAQTARRKRVLDFPQAALKLETGGSVMRRRALIGGLY